MLTICSLRKFGIGYVVFAVAMASMMGCSEKKPPSYQGYIEGEFVYVAAAEAGRLDRLMVARGDSTVSGSILFGLESENEAALQRQVRHQLGAAEALLRDLMVGKRPPEVAVIREQLAQATAEGKRAEAQRLRDETQYQAGGISVTQLEATRATAASNAARVRELDALGRLRSVVDQGWTIEYTEYADESSDSLPRKIDIHRGDTRLRLIVDAWNP